MEITKNSLETLELIEVTYTERNAPQFYEGEKAREILASCDDKGMFNPSEIFPNSRLTKHSLEGQVIKVSYGIRATSDYDGIGSINKAELKFEEYVQMGKPTFIEKATTIIYKPSFPIESQPR